MFILQASNQIPFSIIEAGNLVNGEHFLHSRRCLDFFVLLVGVEGKLYISQDDVPYVLEPGTFILLMPRVWHDGYAPSEGKLSYYWCHFYMNGPYKILTEKQAKSLIEQTEDPHPIANHYLLPQQGSFSNSERVLLEFRQLIDFSLQKSQFGTAANYAASILGIELTHEYTQRHRQTTLPRSFGNLVELQEYIRLHYNENLSVTKLAQHFGYNPNYLSSIYKKCTGESLVHYINQTRIAVAKTILLHTNDSINTVADKVGYADSKYFIRIFRIFVGTTPAAFRNAYYHKHINYE